MNNFVEHVHPLSAQADADDIVDVLLDTAGGPMTLVSISVYLSAVTGSPTAVTIDLDITDGTTTLAAIAASSVGTAAGATYHTPAAADQEAGNHIAAEDSTPSWRYQIDLNFTAGTSPTVTGHVVVRWAR